MKSLLILVLTCGFSSHAHARLSCEKFFTDSTRHELATINSQEIRTQMITRFPFQFEGRVQQVLQSDDPRIAAVFVQKQGRDSVQILDLQKSQVILSEEYRWIRSIHFIKGSSYLLVNAAKVTDGEFFRAYLLDLNPPAALPAPIKESSTSTWLELVQRSYGLSLSGQNSVEGDSLDLKGNRRLGVNVAQVVADPELPYILVTQNSGNDTPAQYGDGDRVRKNKSTQVFDAGTRQNVRSLNYDGLVPFALNMSPDNKFVVLHLESPLVGIENPIKIAVVDANRLDKVIFEYELTEKEFPVRARNEANRVLRKRIETFWSADGTQIAIIEKETGSILIRDLKVNKNILVNERAPKNRWPILEAKFLSTGELIVLRQGLESSGKIETREIEKAIFAEVYQPAGQGINSQNFQIDLNLSRQLFQRDETSLGKVNVVEMNRGRTLAVVLSGQIILVDKEDPRRQSIINPFPDRNRNNLPLILLAQKVSEKVLRLSTDVGIFDMAIDLR